MAKRGRPARPKVERVIKLKRSEFNDAVRDMARMKDQAKKYTGELGAFSKDYAERTGLHPEALRFAVKLNRLGDDLKCQALMDDLLYVFELSGKNDQGTLFGRVQRRLDDVEQDEDEEDDDDVDQARPAGAEGAAPLDQSNAMPLDQAATVIKKANAGKRANAGAKPRAQGAPLSVVPRVPSPATEEPFGKKLN